jgi:glycosyltransferase involved in cell wall biosynthesis
MNQKPFLSTIIIAKNEGKRISSCIKHISWTDELIVIDNGSTDDTAKIAKHEGAIVIKRNNKNFSLIRNLGARYASGTWILYVDADETVTPALRNEIMKTIHSKNALSAYIIPRQNIYLGREWPYRDGMIRLIRKEFFVTWEGVLHEHAIVRGTIGTLENACIHTTHRCFFEMVEKTNEWSLYEATLRFSARHPRIYWWRIIRVMVGAFINSFFGQGGWKAGTVGWMESIYQSFSMFVTYAKVWEMQNVR